MKYLLDTNAISALMKGEAKVLNRLKRLSRSDVSVPQPVFAEIAYGIERLPPSKRKEDLRERFRLIREEFSRSAWNDDVSDHFGSIKAQLEKKGQRIENFDAAIAAHALAASAVLISSNHEQMTRVPTLAVEDWLKD